MLREPININIIVKRCETIIAREIEKSSKRFSLKQQINIQALLIYLKYDF